MRQRAAQARACIDKWPQVARAGKTLVVNEKEIASSRARLVLRSRRLMINNNNASSESLMATTSQPQRPAATAIKSRGA